jgi:pilus assembly protein CpaF
MEYDSNSFRKEILIKRRERDINTFSMTFEEALEFAKQGVGEKVKETFDEEFEKEKGIIKDKKYLKEKQKKYKEIITDFVLENNLRVVGYEGKDGEKTKKTYYNPDGLYLDKINKIKDIHDFIDEIVPEFIGWSVLQTAFEDNLVSDIFCLDDKTIYLERAGKNVRYPFVFRSKEHYKNFVERILGEAKEEIDGGENKIVHFEVYQNRGCATHPAVSPRDYSLTFRKHGQSSVTVDSLLEQKILNEEMLELIGVLIDGETNIIYAGITGSGKTTSIRAFLDYFVAKNNKRMLVCEDTQELFPQNEHTLELVSFDSEKEELKVSLGDLVETALRLKPKYIVVGEVRKGKEAVAAVEAMETGHSTIFTMHGGTVWNIVNRLVTKYMTEMPSLGVDIVERIIGSAVDYICVQDDVPGIGRKITSIHEISYSFEERRVIAKEIFRFDFGTQDFIFLEKLSPEKADKMLRRGIPKERLNKWVAWE